MLALIRTRHILCHRESFETGSLVWSINSSRGPCTRAAKHLLSIKLLEITVDAPLTECDPPVRGKISGDSWPLGHSIMQRHHARHLALEPPHPLGEGVAQPFHNLEKGKVDVAKPAPQEIRAAASRQHTLEVA